MATKEIIVNLDQSTNVCIKLLTVTVKLELFEIFETYEIKISH